MVKVSVSSNGVCSASNSDNYRPSTSTSYRYDNGSLKQEFDEQQRRQHYE